MFLEPLGPFFFLVQWFQKHLTFLTFLTFQQFRAFFNIFNISAVSSLFFGVNMLETAGMLKIVFFFEGSPMVPKTFNIFNIFNISAVSSIFLTFLTFQQFRAFFFGKYARNSWNVKSCVFFLRGAQWFQNHLTFFNIFNISAVSSNFLTFF